MTPRINAARFAAAIACLLAAAAVVPAGTPKTYTNPVIDEIGPADPHVIRHDGRYYLYPTGDNRTYRVYDSRNLVRWRKGPVVFRGANNVWAPDVFYNPPDRTFYLYYTVDKHIGVASCKKPDGRFTGRTPLFDAAIDAHLFRDADGRYYLYYVALPGFRIHVQRMKDPVTKQGAPRQIIHPTAGWETRSGRVTEGPWMLTRGGTYYLLYSGSGASTLNYAVGYAVADSPLGPFRKHPGNPIVHRGGGVLGPGHGSVVADAAGRLWHVYHQQKDGTRKWNRFICIDPLRFDEQGVLRGTATRDTPRPAPAE